MKRHSESLSVIMSARILSHYCVTAKNSDQAYISQCALGRVVGLVFGERLCGFDSLCGFATPQISKRFSSALLLKYSVIVCSSRDRNRVTSSREPCHSISISLFLSFVSRIQSTMSSVIVFYPRKSFVFSQPDVGRLMAHAFSGLDRGLTLKLYRRNKPMITIRPDPCSSKLIDAPETAEPPQLVSSSVDSDAFQPELPAAAASTVTLSSEAASQEETVNTGSISHLSSLQRDTITFETGEHSMHSPPVGLAEAVFGPVQSEVSPVRDDESEIRPDRADTVIDVSTTPLFCDVQKAEEICPDEKSISPTEVEDCKKRESKSSDQAVISVTVNTTNSHIKGSLSTIMHIEEDPKEPPINVLPLPTQPTSAAGSEDSQMKLCLLFSQLNITCKVKEMEKIQRRPRLCIATHSSIAPPSSPRICPVPARIAPSLGRTLRKSRTAATSQTQVKPEVSMGSATFAHLNSEVIPVNRDDESKNKPDTANDVSTTPPLSHDMKKAEEMCPDEKAERPTEVEDCVKRESESSEPSLLSITVNAPSFLTKGFPSTVSEEDPEDPPVNVLLLPAQPTAAADPDDSPKDVLPLPSQPIAAPEDLPLDVLPLPSLPTAAPEDLPLDVVPLPAHPTAAADPEDPTKLNVLPVCIQPAAPPNHEEPPFNFLTQPTFAQATTSQQNSDDTVREMETAYSSVVQYSSLHCLKLFAQSVPNQALTVWSNNAVASTSQQNNDDTAEEMETACSSDVQHSCPCGQTRPARAVPPQAPTPSRKRRRGAGVSQQNNTDTAEKMEAVGKRPRLCVKTLNSIVMHISHNGQTLPARAVPPQAPTPSRKRRGGAGVSKPNNTDTVEKLEAVEKKPRRHSCNRGQTIPARAVPPQPPSRKRRRGADVSQQNNTDTVPLDAVRKRPRLHSCPRGQTIPARPVPPQAPTSCKRRRGADVSQQNNTDTVPLDAVRKRPRLCVATHSSQALHSFPRGLTLPARALPPHGQRNRQKRRRRRRRRRRAANNIKTLQVRGAANTPYKMQRSSKQT